MEKYDLFCWMRMRVLSFLVLGFHILMRFLTCFRLLSLFYTVLLIKLWDLVGYIN